MDASLGSSLFLDLTSMYAGGASSESPHARLPMAPFPNLVYMLSLLKSHGVCHACVTSADAGSVAAANACGARRLSPPHAHAHPQKERGAALLCVCVCASGLGLTLRKGARWAECARASLLREGCVGGNGGGRVTVCESMDGSEGDVSSVRPSRAVSNSDVFFFSVFSLANSENSKAKKLQPPKKKSDVRGMGGMGYGVCGVWGIWGMGYMGYGGYGVWGKI